MLRLWLNVYVFADPIHCISLIVLAFHALRAFAIDLVFTYPLLVSHPSGVGNITISVHVVDLESRDFLYRFPIVRRPPGGGRASPSNSGRLPPIPPCLRSMTCSWPWLSRSVNALRRYATAAAVVLRPYQESCLEACVDALRNGSTRIGVSLPTGSGKTTVFISLLSRLGPPAHSPHATRSLVIVNSVELAQQTADQARRLFPEWSGEIEQGRDSASGTADL